LPGARGGLPWVFRRMGEAVADLRDVVQESWSRAVLAASSVEEQAQELVARIGQALQDTPLSPEGARNLLGEVTGQLEDHRRQLRAHVEEAVRNGVARLRLPSHSDLKAMGHRLDLLDQRLGRLEEKAKG
jgi:polyhydroxyalkanoate synthesis regulator phasin